jgi:hypothetical protein
VVGSTPRPLHPWGKSPSYPLGRRLNGYHQTVYTSLSVLKTRWPRQWPKAYIVSKLKARLKLSHYTPRRRLGERRYSSSFSTSALEGGEWSASRPGRDLAPGKGSRYPLDRRLGGPQSRSGQRSWRKNSIKSSRSISRVRWIKETDVSRTVSVFIIMDVCRGKILSPLLGIEPQSPGRPARSQTL